MSFLEFKDKMYKLGCFNIHQVYAWRPDFDRNNFFRWTKKGLLIRLRQGYYTFPEYKNNADYTLYFANRIYRPSYVSLHTALSFYGMIPESVVRITSVTSLKTANFSNALGEYDYKSIHRDLIFGYDLKPFAEGVTLQIALPEKALIDLLYLYPFYKTEQEMEDLRLDDDFLKEKINPTLMEEYTVRFKNKALEKRISTMMNTYRL